MEVGVEIEVGGRNRGRVSDSGRFEDRGSGRDRGRVRGKGRGNESPSRPSQS